MKKYPQGDHITSSSTASIRDLKEGLALTRFHKKILLSFPTDRSIFSEGCKASPVIAFLCPLKECKLLQSLHLHIPIVPCSVPVNT